jgi:hypothetical protein
VAVSERIARGNAREGRRQESREIVSRAPFAVFVLLVCAALWQVPTAWGREQFVRREAPFPAIFDPPAEANSAEPVRYEVLRGDFHMHTVHSDGTLSPTDRVLEAWQYGYDVIAITDHSSFAAYEEARSMADALGILLVRGMETGINGNEHLVAINFSAAYEPRNPHQWAETEGQSQVFYQDEWRRIAAAGGYVLYAHPHVGLREPMLWGIRTGLLQGIEVKNDVVGSDWNTVFSHGTWWYPSAFDWAVDYGLTLFANSDVHGARSDAEQATTLVLVKERSVAGVMEALRAGRTLASFNNMLCAHEWVLELLMANMVDVRLNETEDGAVFLRLQNSGPKELTAEIEGIPVSSVTLGAYQTTLVGLRRQPEAITMTWKNLYTRPATNLATTHLLTDATQ